MLVIHKVFYMVAELVWLGILAGLVIRLLCRLRKGLVSGSRSVRMPKRVVVLVRF